MTWIESLLLATKDSESPRKYYYWAGLSAISAVVKNNVYLDKFYYKLYPNIYVLLIGRSGLRKGPPVALAKKLVSAVNNTRIISGRTSIQAVIKELSTAYTVPGAGAPIVDATGYLVSSEFAAFIIQDQQALTILTDLYDGDYHSDGWDNTTKSSGKEKLKNICVSMIGAANEVHFKDAVPDNALGGGFVARTFIIHADKKSGVNPLTEKPSHIVSIGEMAEHLRKLAEVKGQFVWSHDGKELYDQWYAKFSEGEYQDQTGTLERLHDHILKTAMLLSLSRGTDLTLGIRDVAEAIKACEDFVPGARKVAMGSGGSSVSAPGTAVLLKDLLARAPDYAASRDVLLRRNWTYFDSFEFDRISESLISQGALRMEFRMNGDGKKEIWYALEQKVIDKFQKIKAND